MIRYIVKRLGQSVIVLICVSIFTFFLIRLAPGNPALMMVPDGSPDSVVEAMENKLGLHDPLYVQYFRYINGVLHGDLGTSTRYQRPVLEIVMQRFPYTAKLALMTIAFGLMLAIPLGIYAGSHRGKPSDFFAMFFALLGQSTSPVWLAVFNVFLFAVWLKILPASGITSWVHYILPVLTLGYPMAAESTRVGRSGMIEALNEDYITATYAKGMSAFTVNWKYAFKNAVIPIITLVGMSLGSYLAGTVIVETVFGVSGLGQLITMAVGNRDYPLVQSMILISAMIITVLNLLVDIINSFIDPRIKLE